MTDISNALRYNVAQHVLESTLNLLDLLVYAVAKARDQPLLCTGKDFAATDLELHAASRLT